MNEDLSHLNMKQLKYVVRMASFPAYIQIESFPSQVVVADEIAIDFDNWCRWALQGADAPPLTEEQRSSLIALNSRLDRMSGEHNAELWTDEALRYNSEWDDVRNDARRILDAFGWSIDE